MIDSVLRHCAVR